MIDPVVFKRIPDCDATALEAVADIGVSDLHEALGPVSGRMALMTPRMRAIRHDLRCVGQAVTAYNYPGDNLMIHKALQLTGAGNVLVLCNGGGWHGALWGEMAALAARKKGVAGVIADGPVRDVDAVRNMGFPVWSTAISPSHPEKRGPGAVNIPVVCDGILVEPGDIVAADGDGVVIIPRSLLPAVAAAARKRIEKEEDIRAQISAGRSLHEVTGIDKSFAAAGLREVDGTWLETGWSGRGVPSDSGGGKS